jgi:hypothetical protein
MPTMAKLKDSTYLFPYLNEVVTGRCDTICRNAEGIMRNLLPSRENCKKVFCITAAIRGIASNQHKEDSA